jgi:hypothetical protein
MEIQNFENEINTFKGYDFESEKQKILERTKERCPPRNVSVCLNLEILDLPPCDEVISYCKTTTLSLWGANETEFASIKEGESYRVLLLLNQFFNLAVCSNRNVKISTLKTIKNTKRLSLPGKSNPLFKSRKLIACDELYCIPQDSEVDMVLVILSTKFVREIKDKAGITSVCFNVIATDLSNIKVIFSINFGTAKKNMIKPGSTIFFKNLKYLYSSKNIHVLQSSKNTEMSKNLSPSYQNKSLSRLQNFSSMLNPKSERECKSLLSNLDGSRINSLPVYQHCKITGVVLPFAQIIKKKYKVFAKEEPLDYLKDCNYIFRFDDFTRTVNLNLTDFQMEKFLDDSFESLKKPFFSVERWKDLTLTLDIQSFGSMIIYLLDNGDSILSVQEQDHFITSLSNLVTANFVSVTDEINLDFSTR